MEITRVLSKIESLCDSISYQNIKIEIQTENSTYTLDKQHSCSCGFKADGDYGKTFDG